MQAQTLEKLRTKSALIFLAIVVGLLMALYTVSIETLAEKYPLYSDFIKFHKSALFFWQGQDIYLPIAVTEFQPFPPGMEVTREFLHPNLNPPFQTLLMSPLGLLSYHDAFVIWWVFSLFCGIAAATLISTANKTQTPIAWLAAVALLFAYFPTLVNFKIAQLGLVLLLLCAIAWRALRQGNERLAGATLGLAFSLKLFAGFFLFMLIAQRRWMALSWFLGTFLTCSVVAGAVVGFESYVSYLSVLDQITWHAASWNASFQGYFSRIFGGSENLPLVNWPQLTHALTYLFGVALTALNYWLSHSNNANKQTDRTDLAFALGIVSMLLLSPLGWIYYFPVLLIPFWILWGKLGQFQLGRHPRAFLIFAWFLSTVPYPLLPSSELNDPMVWFFGAGLFFYSLMLFVILILHTAMELRLVQTSSIKDFGGYGKQFFRRHF